MKALLPSWLSAQYDGDTEVQRVARSSLAAAIPPQKRSLLATYATPSTIQYANSLATRPGLGTDEQLMRSLAAALSAVAELLRSLSAPLEENISTPLRQLAQPTLWGLLSSQSAPFFLTRALCALAVTLLPLAPSLLASVPLGEAIVSAPQSSLPEIWALLIAMNDHEAGMKARAKALDAVRKPGLVPLSCAPLVAQYVSLLPVDDATPFVKAVAKSVKEPKWAKALVNALIALSAKTGSALPASSPHSFSHPRLNLPSSPAILPSPLTFLLLHECWRSF